MRGILKKELGDMVGIRSGKGWNRITPEQEALIQKLLNDRKEYAESHKYSSKGVIRKNLKPSYKEIANQVGVLKQTVIIRDNPEYKKKLHLIHTRYRQSNPERVKQWSKKSFHKRQVSGKVPAYRKEWFGVDENLERHRCNARKNSSLRYAKKKGLDEFALKIRREMVIY